MKKLISTIILAALCLAAKAQTNAPANPFTNAPPQYATLEYIIQSIPTVPLNQATVLLDTGIYNGTSVNTQSGASQTLLQNYIRGGLLISTNFIVGGEIRNVISSIQYGGLEIGYKATLTTNLLLLPQVLAGWDIVSHAPKAGAELDFKY